MLQTFIEMTEKTNDKDTLLKLKNDITKKDADIDQIIASYLEDKKTEIITCEINFGHNRSIEDFRESWKKMNPCSKAQNYRQTTVKANGKWKTIYEIAFGTLDTTITASIEAKEKTKQRVIKEAA